MAVRLLQLCCSSGFFGAENVIFELSKGLTKRNIVTVLGVLRNAHKPKIDLAEIAKDHGLPVRVVDCRGQIDLAAIRMIRSIIRNEGVNIVHSHCSKSNVYNLLSTFATKIPSVCTCHNWIGTGWKIRLYNHIDKSCIRFFDKVIAVTEKVRDESLKCGVSQRNLRVIDNGIDVDNFRYSEECRERLRGAMGLASDEKVVGTIARFSKEKNIELLFQALKGVLEKIKNTKLVLVGDGVQRQFLEAEAERMGIRQSILFTGIRRDIPAVLSVFDVFVVTSVNEGLPMVLLEAMAARKPVISTRVGAVPQLINDGQSGVLVDEGDVEALTRNIVMILRQKDMANTLGNNAHAAIQRHYTFERMTQEYMTLYEEVSQK